MIYLTISYWHSVRSTVRLIGDLAPCGPVLSVFCAGDVCSTDLTSSVARDAGGGFSGGHFLFQINSGGCLTLALFLVYFPCFLCVSCLCYWQICLGWRFQISALEKSFFFFFEYLISCCHPDTFLKFLMQFDMDICVTVCFPSHPQEIMLPKTDFM